MNRPLFEKNFNILNLIIDTQKEFLGTKEWSYRKNNLLLTYNEMMEENLLNNTYYSMVHEIRAIELFATMGHSRVAMDSDSEPGVDLFYGRNLIECVVSTPGKGDNYNALKQSGYQVYNRVIDYNEKFRQISLRVLSSLYSKKKKYLVDIDKGLLPSDQPFCIFVNLGSLAQEWFPGKMCNEANRFLVGRGKLAIRVEKDTGKFIDRQYNYDPFLDNNNNSPVCANFFGDIENRCVSAVIISTAELNEKYSNKNTYIFTNPFANNRLVLNDFFGYPYWKMSKEKEYVPRVRGKRVKIKW